MQTGTILANRNLQGDYQAVTFHVPEIARTAESGQFVHVRIGEGLDRILRRPFSIHDVDDRGGLTVVYKIVGAGTRRLAAMRPGEVCDVLGPLGKAYTPVAPDEFPVIVDGGYGSAATYLLARRSPVKGAVLLGARGRADVILADEYRALGFDVRISTNDGSLGHRGFVTGLIAPLLAENPGKKVKFYACGPHPMLIALAKLLQAQRLPGELSLDHLMCCGVGACFACVVKVKADNAEGWQYARACKDGPVFDAESVYTGSN